MAHTGEPGGGTTVKIKIKRVVINPLKMSYESDHAVLTDQQDWKRGTSKYHDQDPYEWCCKPPRRFPISQTKNTKLKIKVVFYPSSKNTETVSGKVVGDGGAFYLKFEGSGTFAPGEFVEVAMTATRPLPDQCIYLPNQAITWRVEAGGEVYPAGTSGPSSIYVTLDKPKDEGGDGDGPTHRRMNAAVYLVERAGSNEPHKIVANLMSRFRGYILQPDPNVPAEYDHPQYFNGVGGAWPLFENMGALGECQAIVRFVKGVIHQVGCPGTAEAVVIHANTHSGRAREDAFGHEGMSSNGWFDYKGKPVFATLADQIVEEGREYPPSHTRGDPRFPLGSPGFNNYEACLKFTHGGETKYYAGGVGVFESKEEVIRVFTALVWASPSRNIRGGYYIDKVVRRYR
jgi:hypothetical protein